MDTLVTCMQDPQILLSQSLIRKNIKDFRIALDNEADPMKIDPETNKSIFEIVLQTYGFSEFVEECLQRGCNVNYENDRIKKKAISYATDSTDPKVMASILSRENVPVNSVYSNLTPLNSLAKNITSENFSDVLNCMKLLIQYGADPNKPDQNGITPIVNIIKNKKLTHDRKKQVITYLLENCSLDLDSYNDGQARKLLTKTFPDLPLLNVYSDSGSYGVLLSCLKNRDEQGFLQKYPNYINNNLNDNQSNTQQEEIRTLLIETIQNGQNEALKRMLNTMEIKDSINNFKRKNYGINLLQIACTWGNNEALKILLEDNNFTISKDDCLLKTIIQHSNDDPLEEFVNYDKCFDTLLESQKVNVNEVDASGTSALYYAVKNKNEKAINKLLEKGAYLGTKSKFDDIAITGINPELLENYLDSCVQTNNSKPTKSSFEIIFDYKNLKPIELGNQKNIIKSEMTPIEHIAETKELRHLLKHPVITSFLFLKWQRLSLIFYINFILYVLFCISLVTFIILKFNDSDNTVLVNIFYILSILGLFYMIIRELLQLVISPPGFMRSIINYMEIALIILTIITLSEPNYEKENQRVLAVFTILLATIELCLLVGSLPILSISTHMLMLKAVSETFLKCFGLYSMFVITFSICFYILFGKTDNSNDRNSTETINNNENENENGNDNEESEFNKFGNPFAAIIKTIVMLTGEFDAGDIAFSSFYSYFVFLLFVFFMSIVLFNLLNGLAVSDTQTIKSQAELNGSICRTIILSGYERSLSGKDGRTSYFLNQPLRSICKRLINIFPDTFHENKISVLPNNRNRIAKPKRKTDVELGRIINGDTEDGSSRKNFLDDSEAERGLSDPPIKLPCCCSFITNNCMEMDTRTVKTALHILDKKEKNEKNENRFQKIEKNIEEILRLLRSKK